MSREPPETPPVPVAADPLSPARGARQRRRGPAAAAADQAQRRLGPHHLTADRGDNGVRLDLVLLRHLRGPLALSRRRFQHAIEGGDVAVNGVVVTRTSARVVTGDRIDASLPAPVRRQPPQPQNLPLDVLFEDEHLLAVNKPPGIVAHPSYKHPDGTLFNALLWHVRGTDARPRLLHRLDKDTSGVVLVSKTSAAHAAVVRAMRAGAVRKEYVAIVRGVPRPASGDIVLALGRDPSDVRRVAATESHGKESVTRYETVSTGRLRRSGLRAQPHDDDVMRVSLVRCELVTGRMHQIRVHLAARGWPIVGDRVYGAAVRTWDPALAGLHAAERTWDPASAGLQEPAGLNAATRFPRQALHAWRVSLAHPATGDQIVIVAPIPEDMRALMDGAGLRVHA
jgi:23S rRNA pseudouridine1911/1915/1917 synthase